MINQFTLLIEELQGVLDLIEIAEDKAKTEAAAMGCDVMDLRTADGDWVMHRLIFSRAQALAAMSYLKKLEAAEMN